MPSQLFASKITDSLAEGENYDDFAHLFDALLLLRRPHQESLGASETIVGWLLCLFVPDKPPIQNAIPGCVDQRRASGGVLQLRQKCGDRRAST